MDISPELSELALQKELPGRRIHHGIESVDDFGEYSSEERDGSSGHARNHIGGTHAEALDSGNNVSSQSVHCQY